VEPPDVDLGRKLGYGGFGVVYEARCKRTGNLFAEKQIPVKCDAKAELCEVQEQSRFRHRHVVQALWATIDGKALRIGLELLPGGSLHDLLANGGLEEDSIAHYTRQLALGVTHLHGKLTVHRDLKASNLLLSADRRELKIADFGLARRLKTVDEEVDGRCGTLEWMAPEALFAKRAGLQSDVWSVGCTVWEMAMGARPWSYLLRETDAENERLLRKVVRRPQTARLPDTLSPVGRQFIRGCMQSRRASRPRALQLLDAPFLDTEGANAVRKRGREDELVEESVGKRYKDEDFDL
jgi:serine/threonine protein kinase